MKRLSAKATRLKVSIRMNCLLLLLILATPLLSQGIQFEPVTYNITTEHGLPSLETYSVKQDSKGYVWICTDGGVSRYDGFEFKNYTIADGLTDNVVFDIYEDFKGRIWFLTYNSLLCYYEDGVIVPYKFNKSIAPFVKNISIISRTFTIDENETIHYELNNCGILKIDKFGNTEQLIPKSSDFILTTVNNRNYITRNISAVVGFDATPPYISKFTRLINGKLVVLDSVNQSRHYFVPEKINNIEPSYFLYDNVIFNYKTSRKIYSETGILHFVMHNSELWLCTTTGLKRGKIINGKLKIVQVFLDENVVSNVSFFDDGSMWVTTTNSGVFFFNKYNFTFSDESLGLMKPEVIHIRKFQNNILVGGMGFLQNISSNSFIDIDHNLMGHVRFEIIENILLIKEEGIQKFTQFQPNIFGHQWASSIAISDSLVYSIKGATIYEFNSHSCVEREIYNGFYNKFGKGQFSLNQVTVNDKREVIVSSKNELFKLIDDRLKPIQLPLRSTITITSLKYHPKWGLIIGTSGNGLILFKNNRLQFISEKEGLLSNIVNTIEVSQDGKIFVGSPDGLSIVKPNRTIGVFGKNQALNNTDVNAIFIDDEYIYLGTKSGLFKLANSVIDQCFERTKTVKVKLASVIYDDEFVDVKNHLIFPNESILLQINFHVFQFTNWYSKQFQYKIGEDGKWVDIDRPVISLYRPVGEFNVYMRYLDDHDNWSSTHLLCKVSVKLPFWKRWYFWTIIAFGSIILIFYLYQRRQQHVIEKLINESNMLSLEQQMQNARMNPHFIFNVLNSIHSYVLKEETENAEKYLMKFSKLMREILASSKEGTISIQHEVSILNKYLELEQLRHNNEIDYEIKLNYDGVNSQIPSMMIQPFVENAVFYSSKIESTQKSSIAVFFDAINETCIQIRVVNSGIPSVENLEKMNLSSTKNAIGITRKRLENYNKLFNTSDYGVELLLIEEKSTKIELKIPIIKN